MALERAKNAPEYVDVRWSKLKALERAECAGAI
jgi:hypothetical protein